MLGTIRKFSGSIYAKIFLFIIAIPFVFWGMGDVFSGGSRNVIVKIGNDKHSTQQFINYVKFKSGLNKIDDNKIIEKYLYTFISEKLIAAEVESYNVKLTEKSLSQIIKNQKNFRRDNKFSRTEYEKFLIENNFSAPFYEQNLMNQEKKNQLFALIGGGAIPADFLVNIEFAKINQIRNIQMINLNTIFEKKTNFTEKEIKKFYLENIEQFKEKFKTINFIELNQKLLTGKDEYTDLYFKKIDEIDDLVVNGLLLKEIASQFNLGAFNSIKINNLSQNQDFSNNNKLSMNIIKKIFNADDNVFLIEDDDKYFLIEIIKSEIIQKSIDSKKVKDQIILKLSQNIKRKLVSEIINKINKNEFSKSEFDKLSESQKIPIKKIKIKGQNDTKIMKKELINQIYAYPENRIIVIADLGFEENYLVYIDSIENVPLNKKSEEYKKYLTYAETKLINSMYNTFDIYLKDKYKIDVNYKALDQVNNYFK